MFHIICSPLMANAQNFLLTPLPTQQQLPVAQIHDIVQDEEGYMWYATMGGLCRDNGYQIDVFRPGQNDGGVMASENITDIAVGKGHCILIGTDEGLYQLSKLNYKITRINLKSANSPIIDHILVAHDSTVWVSAGTRIYHFTPTMQLIHKYVVTYQTNSLYEDHQYHIWQLQKRKGIAMLTPNTQSFKNKPWYAAEPTVMIETSDTKQFWVATYGQGIVKYQPSTNHVTTQLATIHDGHDGAKVFSLAFDAKQSLLWSATMNDLYAYRVINGQLFSFSTHRFLPLGNKIVDRLYIDKNSHLWVSGYSPTTFILSYNHVDLLRLEVSEMQQATGYHLLPDRMVKDGEGYYWIWQGRKGLALYQENNPPIFLSNQPIGSLQYVDQTLQQRLCGNGIWASVGGKLFAITHQNKHITATALTVIPQENIRAIAEDATNRLWLTTDQGAWLYNYRSGQLQRLCKSTSFLTNKLIVGNGVSYTIGSNSVWKITENRESIKLPISPKNYFALTMSPEGVLWLATKDGGIYRYENSQLIEDEYISQEGKQNIKMMKFDGTGHLWVLGDQKLIEYHPQNHSQLIWLAHGPRMKMDYYSSLEAMSANQMGVGGAGAFVILNSSTSLNNKSEVTAVPKVSSITFQKEGTQLININEKTINIKPSQATFTVTLSTDEHLYSSNICYAYRLGKNEPWTQLEQGQNFIVFTQLGKGDYPLYVKATDRNGCWGEEQLCLTIHRQAEWYASWWAILIYIAIGSLIIYGLILLNRRIRYLDKLQHLQDKLSLHKVELKQEDIKTDRFDSEFMQQVIKLIELHLSESDYHVEQLCSDMYMSKVNFYRKLKKLTGSSPIELLHEIRLKQAAHLLVNNPKVPVADIAAKVGFATPSYFTKCFKKLFGVMPTQYAESQKEKE